MTSPSLRNCCSFLLALASGAALADVVARVGNTEVTSEEIRGWLGGLSAQERAAAAKDPALLAQEVRRYLARRAVLQVARAKKWDEQPWVKAQLDRVRDEALAELYLQSVSAPPDGYPGDAEVQAVYDAGGAAFEVPRKFRVAQIFVPAAKGDPDGKAQKRAAAIAAKLREKGADFAAVARAESAEANAAERGGEIGWLSEAEMVPGIRSTVTSLAKNGVSDPIRLDDGWHIVKVLDVRAASKRPLSEVRGAIAAQLRAERAQANRQAYLGKLLEQSPPAVNELALSKVLETTK
ncbi:MAG TPA: peptidylprolyl isomerase [Myxococcales bacterium]|nr:peptidylprolyl isomerase [Myxococcales bacterium]